MRLREAHIVCIEDAQRSWHVYNNDYDDACF